MANGLLKMMSLSALLLGSACATAGAQKSESAKTAQVGENAPLLVSTSDNGTTLVQRQGADRSKPIEVKDGKALGVKNASSDAGPLLCVMEMDTGTHFAHEVCRYQNEQARDRERTQLELMERYQKGTPPAN